MKKLLLLLLLGSTYVYGQRGFTIEETVYGPGKFAPKTLTAPKWVNNSNAFSSLDSTFQNLIVRDAKDSWKAKEISNVTELKGL
ncbi:hypothetical protein ACFQ2C_08155 [Sphingobacterium daejeonense]|uniref:Uncharacterized protein n=1 Tax=Sphingobacterium daejeonense TaxID=371142 RepID=A0ABW3RKV1_9SPHI